MPDGVQTCRDVVLTLKSLQSNLKQDSASGKKEMDGNEIMRLHRLAIDLILLHRSQWQNSSSTEWYKFRYRLLEIIWCFKINHLSLIVVQPTNQRTRSSAGIPPLPSVELSCVTSTGDLVPNWLASCRYFSSCPEEEAYG